MVKIIRNLLFVLIISTLLGCARTASEKTTTLFLELTINFRETIEPSKYHYLVILSSQETPDISAPNKDPFSPEFIPLPGESFEDTDLIDQNKELKFYYENYFSTWAKYLLSQTSNFLLFDSNSTGFDATTNDKATYIATERQDFSSDSSLTNPSTTLTLVFDLKYISPSLSGTQYIRLATTQYDAETESNFLLDITDTTIGINIEALETIPLTDEFTDTDIAGSADIQSWQAKIY